MEKEEAQLNRMKETLDRWEIPGENLDQAILAGYQKAKKERRRQTRKKYRLIAVLAVAFIFLSFVSSIYHSSAFADYLSKLPGMEPFVEFFRDDKGLTAAVKNEYQEMIGLSQKKNGITMTIDSVIKDETGIIFFYSLVSDTDRGPVEVENKGLLHPDRKEFENYSFNIGYDLEKMEAGKKYADSKHYFFTSPFKDHTFRWSVDVKGKGYSEHFEFAIELSKSHAKPKKYQLEKEFNFAGQRVLLHSVSVSPILTDIHLEADKGNSKRILNYGDIHLVDEKGETWGKDPGGLIGRGKAWGKEYHRYLQSNYFKEPKKLYLVITRMQAIDREKANLQIDTKTKAILKAPDQNIRDLQVIGDTISMKYLSPKVLKEGISFGQVYDATGKEIQVSSSSSSVGTKETDLSIILEPGQTFVNPLNIEFGGYPSWIEDYVKIRIK
ncbi:DUF4179 domain-containing protein [Bacillus testis]|uniref:DUF4179 domain-containing protein n=1 Tax=Bacillus testis TaxID=1622072 RepID=UPI00067ED5A9|nr:DUF4179 domain-containing protein [Bacillus testis]